MYKTLVRLVLGVYIVMVKVDLQGFHAAVSTTLSCKQPFVGEFGGDPSYGEGRQPFRFGESYSISFS